MSDMAAASKPRSASDSADPWLVEELDWNLYRSTADLNEGADRAAGRVLAQSLLAAGRTVVAGLAPRSLRAAHVRPPDSTRTVVFEVSRDRDAPGCADRRVVALQDRRVVVSLSISFGLPEHAAVDDMVGTDLEPPSDGSETLSSLLPGVVLGMPPQPGNRMLPHGFWVRGGSGLPDDSMARAAALAFVTDAVPTTRPEPGETPSEWVLDHSMWFHQASRLDDWVFVTTDTQPFGAAERLAVGSVRGATGELVASFVKTVDQRSG